VDRIREIRLSFDLSSEDLSETVWSVLHSFGHFEI